ncbi:hypothetical protein [Phytoactinopolyspora mesophila]|uniref:Uncharacterized protein n=1 Tax=Phytoactinopolyspora mesophila TaxID=2650750 RepID=A0A7K3M9W5_9ACTN|nr:hypothetical protein [Phytoactinopolyspora mesophila]NDL59198.1 hypothetical protein [Phytoactinopolyspora mesophila]
MSQRAAESLFLNPYRVDEPCLRADEPGDWLCARESRDLLTGMGNALGLSYD